MSNTPRTDALVERNKGIGNLEAHNAMLDHARVMERKYRQFKVAHASEMVYAQALRNLINKEILDLSKAGFQGSADKLEGALDRVDAIVGEGPYAGRKGSDGEEVRSLPVGGAQDTQAGGDSGGMPLSVGRSRPDQTAIFCAMSDSADFTDNTWTFHMIGDYRVSAGRYRITRLADDEPCIYPES